MLLRPSLWLSERMARYAELPTTAPMFRRCSWGTDQPVLNSVFPAFHSFGSAHRQLGPYMNTPCESKDSPRAVLKTVDSYHFWNDTGPWNGPQPLPADEPCYRVHAMMSSTWWSVFATLPPTVRETCHARFPAGTLLPVPARGGMGGAQDGVPTLVPSELCPSTHDVMNTAPAQRWRVWDDSTINGRANNCSDGCTISKCSSTPVPCCVRRMQAVWWADCSDMPYGCHSRVTVTDWKAVPKLEPSSSCPAREDVLNTMASMRWRLWNDRDCAEGCTLARCGRIVPCCVRRQRAIYAQHCWQLPYRCSSEQLNWKAPIMITYDGRKLTPTIMICMSLCLLGFGVAVLVAFGIASSLLTLCLTPFLWLCHAMRITTKCLLRSRTALPHTSSGDLSAITKPRRMCSCIFAASIAWVILVWVGWLNVLHERL